MQQVHSQALFSQSVWQTERSPLTGQEDARDGDSGARGVRQSARPPSPGSSRLECSWRSQHGHPNFTRPNEAAAAAAAAPAAAPSTQQRSAAGLRTAGFGRRRPGGVAKKWGGATYERCTGRSQMWGVTAGRGHAVYGAGSPGRSHVWGGAS